MGVETKFIYYSATNGAPTLNQNAGTLISVLDACLVNGFGSTAITGGTLTGTTATVTMSSAASFDIDTVVEIAGATPSGLNGQWRVTARSATSVTFACTVSAGSISAAGTIKVAALGWSKVYSGTNLAAYRSTDANGTQDFLRVDDSAAYEARVTAYETMSDVNTGTGQFPLSAQYSGGLYWAKSNNTVARDWFVLGDTRGFYIGVAPQNTSQQMVTWWFGDFLTYRTGDLYACYLTGNPGSYVFNTLTAVGDIAYSNRTLSTRGYFPRSYLGLGGSIAATHVGMLNRNTESYSGNVASNYDSWSGFPNPPDNSLILCGVQVYDGISRWRGTMPGLIHTTQYLNFLYPTYTKLDGTGAYAGKKLIAIRCGSPDGDTSSGRTGTFFLDLYGNWRT